MKKYRIILISFTVLASIWIFTRPCIFHPFSKHNSWEWGYREATGYFPDSLTKDRYCPSFWAP